ncbi:hypothetical protein, partial [Pseudomonas chlororaphis]|uniref:hypothetical protein n=1 Tax=Pseudomonas chlororaphis TaxID=587753 RepID=UPI001EE663FB
SAFLFLCFPEFREEPFFCPLFCRSEACRDKADAVLPKDRAPLSRASCAPTDPGSRNEIGRPEGQPMLSLDAIHMH